MLKFLIKLLTFSNDDTKPDIPESTCPSNTTWVLVLKLID